MLRCIVQPGCGRLVVAARDIVAGETVFAEEAYAVSPNVEHPKRRHCVFCAAPASSGFTRCDCCASVFCSELCYNAHGKAHTERGECAALLFSQLMRSRIPDEDYDTFQMACLLLARCAAEGKAASLLAEPSTHESDNLSASARADVETVGLGNETADPLAFLSPNGPSAAAVAASCYEHVQCLVTNLKQLNTEILADYSRLYDLYVEGVNRRKPMSKSAHLRLFLPTAVSPITFLSLCCAFQCNGFGFRDSQGRRLATAVYPQSSYFNHSCAPNLGRRNLKQSRVMEFFATRNVRRGEKLCISYVDVKLPAAERIAKLKGVYAFACCCPRCAPEADYLSANTTIGDNVTPLCEDCQSQILRPLQNGRHICPCCDKVQVVTK